MQRLYLEKSPINIRRRYSLLIGRFMPVKIRT